MRVASARAVTSFGVLTVGVWLLHAFLPHPIWPFTPLPNFEGLLREVPPWIREQVPAIDKPHAQVIANLHRESLILIGTAWLLIATGVASGVLVALQRRSGRWLALGLCAWLMAREANSYVAVIREHGASSLGRYLQAQASYPPFLAARVLDIVFSALTLVYLTRGSVIARLKGSAAISDAPRR